MTYDIDQIRKILPHRYPFLLVDGVEAVSGAHIEAFKLVSANEPQFNGHFPHFPIMPGVLIVEALAQSGGILAHHCGDFDGGTQDFLFMGIDNAKFRKPVRPGQRMDMSVTTLRKGRVWKMEGIASVSGEKVAEAKFIATIVARPSGGIAT